MFIGFFNIWFFLDSIFERVKQIFLRDIWGDNNTLRHEFEWCTVAGHDEQLSNFYEINSNVGPNTYIEDNYYTYRVFPLHIVRVNQP